MLWTELSHQRCCYRGHDTIKAEGSDIEFRTDLECHFRRANRWKRVTTGHSRTPRRVSSVDRCAGTRLSLELSSVSPPSQHASRRCRCRRAAGAIRWSRGRSGDGSRWCGLRYLRSVLGRRYLPIGRPALRTTEPGHGGDDRDPTAAVDRSPRCAHQRRRVPWSTRTRYTRRCVTDACRYPGPGGGAAPSALPFDELTNVLCPSTPSGAQTTSPPTWADWAAVRRCPTT